MYSGKHFFQQNSLYTRELLARLGGFDQKLKMAEDFDVCTRILLKGILPTYLSGPLYFHRLHKNNLSQVHLDHPDAHQKDVIKLFTKHESLLKEILSDFQLAQIKEYLL